MKAARRGSGRPGPLAPVAVRTENARGPAVPEDSPHPEEPDDDLPRPADGPGGHTPRLGAAFHRFWSGNVASNLADGVMLTALPMLAALLTNDPLAVAGLTAARYLPWLLFGLFVGALVDRVDRIRAMVVANVVRGAAVLALAAATATGHTTIALLYVVMFAVMTCESVYDIAARAALPALARGAVDRANGRLVAGREVAQEFVGAPTAGFLFAVAAALPLAVNAGAYLLGALILLGPPLSARRPAPAGGSTAAGPVRSVLSDVGEGLRYVFTDPPLRAHVFFLAVINLAAGAQLGVFVLIVREHFGVPERLFGVFLAVAAVGAIGGAAVVGRLAARSGGTAPKASVEGARPFAERSPGGGRREGRFGVIVGGYLGQSVLCVAFALAPNAVAAAVAWALVAAASTLSNVMSTGVLQQIVPERLMGRVMSANRVLGFGLLPLGALLGGLLGRVDLRLPSLFASAVFAVATLAALRHLRATSARADDAERAALGGGPDRT